MQHFLIAKYWKSTSRLFWGTPGIPRKRMGWKVYTCRLIMMQWSIWLNAVHVSNIVSPVVHTLLPSVLQDLDSCVIQALILILEKVLNCRYDLIISPNTASQPRLFSLHFGDHKIVRWSQIRRIWRMINQFKATVMHSSHCKHRLVYRSIVLVKQDSLLWTELFPGRFEMSLVLLFKILNYLSSVGLSGRKQCS